MNPFERAWLWLFCKMARRYRKSKPPYKNLFNAREFHLVPADMYAAIPSVEEIEKSFEYKPGQPPYWDDELFDKKVMVPLLDQLIPYGKELDAPREGDHHHPDGFFWKNKYFMDADAMSYYAMVRHFKPARVLEVGCGFSTMVASAAIERNGAGEILGIEPFPRPFVKPIKHLKELIEKPVQEFPPEFFNDTLKDGDFLFVDTTHAVKTGSDCLWIYLKVLPKLKRKVYLHAHDIYLPSAMPVSWQLERNFYWTEQYLLLALLLGNPSFQVLYGTHYHQGTFPEKLKALMHGKADCEGGSFWFRRI